MIEGMYSRGTATVNVHFGEAKNAGLINFKEESLTETNGSNSYPIRRNPPMDKPKTSKKKKASTEIEKKKPKKQKTMTTVSTTDDNNTESVCQKLTQWTAYEPQSQDNCAVCFENYTAESEPVSLKCTHHFCKKCIIQCFSQGFLLCPMCKACYGIRVGSMPPGHLKIDHLAVGKCPLGGYEKYGTIKMRMSFDDGTQGIDHPNPGQPYAGTSRTAYLPDTPEGREVLKLIQTAWDRRLVFRIGTSVTTGADNQVIWNGIHLKTQTHGGPTNYGYPDETYFERVKKELSDKGIS